MLPPGVEDPGEIESYTGADGLRLRLRRVGSPKARHHLIYAHGIESHGAWFLRAAHGLSQHDCCIWLLDRRGSGLNYSIAPGHMPSASILLEDMHCFQRHLNQPQVHLVGLSMGGKFATAYALKHPEGLASLVLITPGLKSKIDLPVRTKLKLLSAVVCGRGAKVHAPLPLSIGMFSKIPASADFIRSDEWRVTRVSAQFFLVVRKLDQFIRQNIPRLRLPTLLVLAEDDQIVDNDGVRELLSGLDQNQVLEKPYSGATHSVQFDQTDQLVAVMVSWLSKLSPEE